LSQMEYPVMYEMKGPIFYHIYYEKKE
jgi:hypothetical protein